MMMRRRDFSGENAWRGTMLERWVRIVAREAGWKIDRSSRLVMRRVFEGGAGWVSGGIEDRSIERGVLGDRGERAGDDIVGEGDECRFCGGKAIASMGMICAWRCGNGRGWRSIFPWSC
jgi:hypothetical protein